MNALNNLAEKSEQEKQSESHLYSTTILHHFKWRTSKCLLLAAAVLMAEKVSIGSEGDNAGYVAKETC